MKEYGGYFECEKYFGFEYHDTFRFDSARSSLAYIIKNRKYKHIHIPYYLCECIQQLLERMNISYSYYHINEKFLPMLDDITFKTTDCLLLVNYFGQLDEEVISYYKNKFNLFLDNTQAFFSKPTKGIDAANSCRKFFGVSGGSYLYTDISYDTFGAYEYDIAYKKISHMVGRFELNAGDFYHLFIENEGLMRGTPIKLMSKYDRNILKSLDYERIISVRKSNFNYLQNRFKHINELEIKGFAGLFMYPLLIKSGEHIKKVLIENKIYVPTLWPNLEQHGELSFFEDNLISNLILLPIDQRYDERDMEYIANVVEQSNCVRRRKYYE